jgi:hypothetical protein
VREAPDRLLKLADSQERFDIPFEDLHQTQALPASSTTCTAPMSTMTCEAQQ